VLTKVIKKLTIPVHVTIISEIPLYSSNVCTREIAIPKVNANNRNNILSRVFNIIFYEIEIYQSYLIEVEFHQIDRPLFSLYFFLI